MAMTDDAPPPPPIITVGIDIGTQSTKVVLGPTACCEIVRSTTGGHATPTAVSFSASGGGGSGGTGGVRRLIGETANLRGENALVHLNRLVELGGGDGVPPDDGNVGSSGDDKDKADPFVPFYGVRPAPDGMLTIKCGDGEGSERTFDSTAALAMLLTRVRSNVESTLDRLGLTPSATTTPEANATVVSYVLTVPPLSGRGVRDAYRNAAFAAGLTAGSGGDEGTDNTGARVVASTTCTAAAYLRKFPVNGGDESTTTTTTDDDDERNKTVLVVDMGHSQTTVSVLRIGGGGEGAKAAGEEGAEEAVTKEGDDEKKLAEDDEEPADSPSASKANAPPPLQILSNISNSRLGAGLVDIQLWNHFQSTLPALANLTPPSRSGQRLLDACSRLKHLLSQLPEGSVTVENINDADVKIALTRSKLVELCSSRVGEALEALLRSALDRGGVTGEDLTSVELLGGGCRIPFVKETILDTVNAGNGEEKLASSHSLDDTSLALGAAVVGQDGSQWMGVDPLLAETTASSSSSKEDEEYRDKLRKDEREMAAYDEEMHKRDVGRNAIEEHVLELRSARSSSKHGELLAGTDMEDHLNATDEWLFSDECHEASVQAMEEKLEAVLAKSNELGREYYEAVKKERDQKEQEMEREAAEAAAAEAAAGGGSDDDDDDHDNRRLPKKRRMEIVLKNKKEANELFGDGNYRHAAARYSKALTHCAKFVDLSPDDKEEVNQVKLSLNLNLALAYAKLDKPDQVLRVCNDALSIDPDSPKALYRRALVYYERKKWDDARTDLNRAAAAAPEDKAIKKLQERVDVMMKRQKAKEKKMAQKMFG